MKHPFYKALLLLVAFFCLAPASTVFASSFAAGDVFANTDSPVSGTYEMFYVNTNSYGVYPITCHLILDQVDVGNMPLGPSSPNGSLGSYGLNYYWAPQNAAINHSSYARCTDSAGIVSTSQSVNYFSVAASGSTTPNVGSITPSSVTANTAVTFSATYASYSSGVTRCQLFDTATSGSWYSSTWSPSTNGTVSFSGSVTAGTHYLHAECLSAAGVWGIGPTTTVTASASGSSAPVVGDVFASVDDPNSGTNTNYYVNTNTSDANPLSCRLLLDSADVGAMTLMTNGSWVLNHYWPSSTVDTVHSAQVRCTNNAGLSATSLGTKYFHVYATTATSAPTVYAITPSTATLNVPVTLSANFTANGSGVVRCALTENGSTLWNSSNWTPSLNGIAQVTQTFTTIGTHPLSMLCVNANGVWGSGPLSVVVVSATSNDVTSPYVSVVTASTDSPQAGTNVLYHVNASDNDPRGINHCQLEVDYAVVGNMPLTYAPTNSYDLSYVWPNSTVGSNHAVDVRCADQAGNWGFSGYTSVHVNASSIATPPSSPSHYSGSLVKLVCSSYAPATDPCHAVYYVDILGRRHPFQNERMFLSWYPIGIASANIQPLDSTQLAALPLGPTVGYRPGSLLIKFPSVPSTYEIDRNGTLRVITSEQAAAALRGPYWNKLIVDENEAYYSQYHFGSAITFDTASAYNVTNEQNAANSIEHFVTR